MNIAPDRWQRIKGIFEAATARPVGERAAFVREQAGSDPALVAEIEALLAQSEAMGDFLEPESLTEDLVPGESIGDFTLVSRLGAGGMGVVWLAEQSNPRRTVALKLLQASAISAEGVRRFRREADLLARLSHEHIAQVYEAGTDDRHGMRRPWFAMELVDGQPIDVHAQTLPMRARIELFLDVCDAVEHAHSRGIVHRDLKPANILVTPSGTAKVLDFGIARAHEIEGAATALHTRTGLLLGTLDYMSPEQLAGDPSAIDERVDVYALGVVLYEMLAGCRPHDTANRPLPEAIGILSTQDPTPLTNYGAQFAGDIETISAKALERDRDRRYASAAEFAADLRRFLAEQPIAARPASTSYRVRKFARRHRGLVAGVAAALVILIVGVIATTMGMLRAIDAEHIAETRRGAAQRSASEAREVQKFLEDILRSIQPDIAAGQDTTLVRRMLDDAAQRIEGRFATQPLVEASLRFTLGTAYDCIGRYDEARAQLERSLALYREHAPSGMREISVALTALGSAWSQTGNYTEAEKCFREALEIERARADATVHDRSSALYNLAHCVEAQRRFADASPLYTEALELLESDGNAENEDLPLVLSGFGGTLLAQGNTKEAEKQIVRALEIERRVHPEGHTHRIECLKVLGALRWRQKDLAGATAATRETVEIGRKLYGAKHPVLVDALSNLAMARAQTGDLEEAETFSRECVEMSRALRIDGHPGFAVRLRDLGYICMLKGKLPEAEELVRDALDRQQKQLEPEDPARLETLYHLAALTEATDRMDEAEKLYREALELSEQALGPHHATTKIFAGKLEALLAPAVAPR